jgi:glycosyltransferase involved in cell wall biosynthesis
MMHLFINALAASAGGGLTYIRNVLPQLSSRDDVRVTVALGHGLSDEFDNTPNLNLLVTQVPVARRFWYEQTALPGVIRSSGANVLISAGNFALRKSPVPQLLLSRNSIYICPDFYRDLLARREYRMWFDTKLRAILAKKSVHWADLTVAPSEAFAADLAAHTGTPVKVVHHGFDHEAFTRDTTPLPDEIEKKLSNAETSLKLLFVSHYNYYRNFETLIRALPLLKQRLQGQSVKLLLTCRFQPGHNPGTYNPRAAAELISTFGISDMILELGALPYQQLHRLYARANLYVSPAYTETFAHPLVEAMDSGLPVIASDIPVHREICGEAAAYFPRFSPADLAEKVALLAESPALLRQMALSGKERSRQYSWKKHVDQILDLCGILAGSSLQTRDSGAPRPMLKGKDATPV